MPIHDYIKASEIEHWGIEDSTINLPMVNKDSKVMKKRDDKYDSYTTFEKIKIIDNESSFCGFRQASEFMI